MGKAELETIFAHSNVGLIAENGAFLRHPHSVRAKLMVDGMGNGGEDWIEIVDNDPSSMNLNALVLHHLNLNSAGGNPIPTLSPSSATSSSSITSPIKDSIISQLQMFTSSTPGSTIIERERTIQWQYSGTDSEFANWQAGELCSQLKRTIDSGSHIRVNHDVIHKQVEVRMTNVDRMTAIKTLLADLKRCGGVTIGFLLMLAESLDDIDTDAGRALICPGEDAAIKIYFTMMRSRKLLNVQQSVIPAANAERPVYHLDDIAEVLGLMKNLST